MRHGESPVILNCDTCGCDFELSARQARFIRSRGRKPQCSRHRRPDPPTVMVTDAERRYWLKRYDDITLASIASALFDAPFRPGEFARRRAELMPDTRVVVASAPPSAVAERGRMS